MIFWYIWYFDRNKRNDTEKHYISLDIFRSTKKSQHGIGIHCIRLGEQFLPIFKHMKEILTEIYRGKKSRMNFIMLWIREDEGGEGIGLTKDGGSMPPSPLPPPPS